MADIPFIVFNLLVALLNLPTLGWNIYKVNSAVASLCFWATLIPLISGINAIIWANDAEDRAPAWCDIVAKLYIGGAVGMTSGPLCIARFLSDVLHPGASYITDREKRIRAITDYTFCFGVPLLVMAASIVYQPSRYAIHSTLGCQYTAINVWPIYPLYLLWPPLFSLMACSYSSYVLYRLWIHRLEWRRLINTSGSALSPGRFGKLVAMAALFAFAELSLSLAAIYLSHFEFGPMVPYKWSYVHDWIIHRWHLVYFHPEQTKATIHDWFPSMGGFIIVVFFGFGKDPCKTYTFICRWLGLAWLWGKINARLGLSWPKLEWRTKFALSFSLFGAASQDQAPKAALPNFQTELAALSNSNKASPPLSVPPSVYDPSADIKSFPRGVV